MVTLYVSPSAACQPWVPEGDCAVVWAGGEGARVEEPDAVDAVLVGALDRADQPAGQRVEQQHALVLARRRQDGPEIRGN